MLPAGPRYRHNVDILDIPPLGSEPPGQQQPILTFENRQYDFNGLSDEIKELVRGLQVADAQIRLQEDTLVERAACEALLARAEDDWHRMSLDPLVLVPAAARPEVVRPSATA